MVASDSQIVARRLLSFFVGLIKILLVVSLLRYVGVNIVPEWFVHLGYRLEAYQWVAGESPPIRYLTNVWRGYVRNQGLFG